LYGADAEGIAQSLVAKLITKTNYPLDDESEVVTVLLDLCDDPYWGRAAAYQLLGTRTRESSPAGISATAWMQVWDWAQASYQKGALK
jgi:hypothetical protein